MKETLIGCLRGVFEFCLCCVCVCAVIGCSNESNNKKHIQLQPKYHRVILYNVNGGIIKEYHVDKKKHYINFSNGECFFRDDNDEIVELSGTISVEPVYEEN